MSTRVIAVIQGSDFKNCKAAIPVGRLLQIKMTDPNNDDQADRNVMGNIGRALRRGASVTSISMRNLIQQVLASVDLSVDCENHDPTSLFHMITMQLSK